MAILKCKMCGGDLNITEGVTVFECEYCGTKQTIPTVDDEKKSNLFNRANRLRMNSEFDKAAGVYESLVADFPEEAEAYWGLVLCRYGIEYVDDAKTGRMIPTCHRSSFESVFDDKDFEMVMEYADPVARKQYREEAKAIEELRKAIIEVSSNEEPYDIFICYKETDENGDRTIDSVIAQDVYTALTEKGYRVFFSRISLEDKLGVEYEPYIFAALNSAKIMLAFGTDYDYYNAVWVKNEWSRFLQLIEKGEKKTLIPCYKNIDAYDMPKEFARLQAQDMGKVGAVQDLIRGIEKIIPIKTGASQTVTSQTGTQQTVIQSAGPNTEALLKRGFMALEDGKFDDAKVHFDKVLDIDAECAEAYLGLTMIDEKTLTKKAFVFKNNLDSSNYKRAIQFASPALLAELNGYEEERKAKEEADRNATREKKYIKANTFLENGNYKFAIGLLEQLGDYKNSKQLLEEFNYIALAEAKQNGKWGFIDKTGKFVIKPIFEEVQKFYENGTARVKLNDDWKLIDTTGEFVIRPTFEDKENYLKPEKLNGKWGFVNSAGKIVIKPTFDWAWNFAENGLASVQQNGKWGYIDKTGTFVISPRFYSAGDFAKNGLARAANPQTTKEGYIDKTGRFVIEPKFYKAYGFNEFDIAIIGEIGNPRDKYGVIDKNGEFVIKPTYDTIYAFDENGFAKVEQNEKCGLIDITGTLVIPPIFDDISGFSENGLASVEQNEKYGFIDKNGEFVIKPIFEYANDFAENGLASVVQNEKCGFIDETGKFIINPVFDNVKDFQIILQSDIEKRKAQWKAANEKQKLIEEQQRLIASRKQQGLCAHCGGAFKGLFTKKCSNCGKEKDY